MNESAMSAYGFFSVLVWGLAFGCGFCIAKGLLEWVGGLISRGASKSP